jgi:hypothetical protein
LGRLQEVLREVVEEEVGVWVCGFVVVGVGYVGLFECFGEVDDGGV